MRKLTQEEINMLDDMDLLYAVYPEAYEVVDEIPESDTAMMITVYNPDDVRSIYEYNSETEGGISHVTDFADAMCAAYKSLGFQNELEITFKGVGSDNLDNVVTNFNPKA